MKCLRVFNSLIHAQFADLGHLVCQSVTNVMAIEAHIDVQPDTPLE